MHTIARRRGYRVTRSRSMVRFIIIIIFFYRTFGTPWSPGGIYAMNLVFFRGGRSSSSCCSCCFSSPLSSSAEMANERRVVVLVDVSFLLFSFLLVVTFADFLSSLFFAPLPSFLLLRLNKVARRRGGGRVRRGRRKLPEGRAARPHGATREWR